MKDWSIQRRVLLIALLPAALVAIVLSVWNTWQQLRAAERQALEHARAVATDIGPNAALAGTPTADAASIEGLMDTLVTDHTAITGIAIIDHTGRVVLRTPHAEDPAGGADGDRVRIAQPIREPASRHGPPTSTNDPESSATVEVAVDLARVRREQIVPLLEGFALTAVALGFTALVAVRIGRGVTGPVHELERTLGEHAHGAPLAPWQRANDPRSDHTQAGRVLVVDDQPVNLKLLELFLEDTDWETVAATGSDEALDHARLTRFGAILMDVHLPDRDGIETSALLRMPGEINARTPIIAITADGFAEQADAAMAAGMNDVLVKPVGRTALLERLAQWSHPGGCDADSPGSGAENESGESGLPPCYDPQDATDRAGGHTGVANELFTMLCRHLPSSRAELRSAHARNDREALLAAAHRLKGAAAYCGVPRLRHEIAVLERCARNGADPVNAVETVCATIDALLRMAERDAPESDSGGA